MRNILITGGTGTIGSHLVSEMIADEHSVYFTSRSMSSAMELIEEKKLDQERCKPIIVDFSQKNAVDSVLDQLNSIPDMIVHNARSLDTLKLDQNGITSNENWQAEFFNGVTFPYQLTMELVQKKTFLKDVVFMSSMYGSVAPNPSLYTNFHHQSPINYGVVKAAQLHLVKELAVRLAPNIKVNGISYGGVEGRADDAFKERYSKLNPLGKMLDKNDLYPPLKYILDNPSLKMTGENLKVDGGWTIW
ncbi:SDR family oxidoreductase [Roseivirga pacifica]|uniref:SDR family oxidoreductase n=1 Tax=Roseivirga pacifica TaxID=1267423 RepID=UPI00227BA552|nr:SDR family oxidoreductase [Roseivirga pacifica]